VESFSRDIGSPSDVEDYPHLLYVKGIIRETLLEFIQLAEADQPTPAPPTEEPPTIGPAFDE
jgi:hypothetical protein